MKTQSCKCHPNSPFHWAHDPRPSIFVTDPLFRAKGVAMDANLTKEENLVAYKQFGIFSRAYPMNKPSPNKHEI